MFHQNETGSGDSNGSSAGGGRGGGSSGGSGQSQGQNANMLWCPRMISPLLSSP